MKDLFNRFVREEEGQDLTEYALLVALIAFVVIIGVTTFGTNLKGYYDKVAGVVGGWNPTAP